MLFVRKPHAERSDTNTCRRPVCPDSFFRRSQCPLIEVISDLGSPCQQWNSECLSNDVTINRTQILFVAILLLSQNSGSQEPEVSKDNLSVHTVLRGDMPLFEKARGSISSLEPPKAVVKVSDQSSGTCEIDGKASVQLERRKTISGKIIKAGNACEIQFSEELPTGSTVGQALGALVQVGELHDVTFFARPAESSENSDAVVFVLEKTSYARRVRVHYGRLSGPLIQIVSGLQPGDQVIVTDTSKWASSPRVHLY